MNSINFNDPANIADPYPVYRQLRESGSPYWLPHTQPVNTQGMWLFSRYNEVAEILRLAAPLSKQITLVRTPGDITPLDMTMLYRDPPEHTRLRNLVNQTFTNRQIRTMETRIAQITENMLARMSARSTGDFIADIALPLPVKVAAEILGVPFEDHDKFYRWITSVFTGFDAVTADTEILMQQNLAMQELVIYLKKLINLRRQQPRDELLSSMIKAHDDLDALSDEELLGMCVLFLIAGFETTVYLLGTGMYTLLRHPDQLYLLKQKPEYLPSAIEEMLRYESPLQRATFRITTKSCELGGKQFREGEQICAVIGAANRDPAQFTHPDTFDITRAPNKHLAFGLGIHTCLGATLARTEAHIMFERILERMPHIKLAEEKPEWTKTTFFRGIRKLPVHY